MKTLLYMFLLFFISQAYVIMDAIVAVLHPEILIYVLFCFHTFTLTGLTQVRDCVHLKPARQLRLLDEDY